MSKQKTTEQWVKEVLEKYPEFAEKYDYTNTVYTGAKNNVEIRCKKHGVFTVIADNHKTRGSGCELCGRERTNKALSSRKGKSNTKRSTEEWVAKVLAKHPEFADKYDYSQAVYAGTDESVTIICKTCGRVCTPKARRHMAGQGCKSCAGRAASANQVPSFQEMVERAKEVHGDKYTYLGNSYTCMTSKMDILCNKCGRIFPQKPDQHIGKKQGCPFCQHVVSSGEKDVFAFVKEHTHCEVQNNVRIVPDFFVGDKKVHKAELDIYVPELKLAIEYNGTYFHDISLKGKGYHIGKRKACEQLGIRMISIWECDWQDDRKRPIIERYLKNALGVREERTVYARNCVVKDVPQDVYREFMEANHVQGYASAKEAKCGLYTKDTNELVACMSFRILKNKDQKDTPFVMWDMVRYATNCNVPGGRSKLFHYMQQRFHMDHVQSFIDRDYFNGASYLKEGWELMEDDQVSISFWSYRGGRMSRQMWWKKNIPATLEKLGLSADLYDETKTQEWNAYNAGCKILENSGNSRFEWHSPEGKKDPLYLAWVSNKHK